MYLLTQEVLPHETESPQTWRRSICSWLTQLKDWIIVSFTGRKNRVSAAVETSTNGPFDDEVYASAAVETSTNGLFDDEVCQYTA